MNDAIPDFTLFGETAALPDVAHAERIRDRAPAHGWTIAAHRHRAMAQLFQIDGGGAEARVDGQRMRLKPGESLWVPARTVHAFEFRPGTEGLVLSFPLALLAGADPALSARLGRPLRGRTDPRLAVLTEAFVAAYPDPAPFRSQRLTGLAQALVATLAATAPAPEGRARAPHRRLAELDALLARHMADGWGAADYAAALAMTPGQLSRICRAAAGTGAAAYIETATLTEACRLLAFTRMPVAEVGYRLGYADPSYFSRRFRARLSETPTDYRARIAG